MRNRRKTFCYFLVIRRSIRQPRQEIQKEKRRNIEQAIKEEREDGLTVGFKNIYVNKNLFQLSVYFLIFPQQMRIIEEKGRGVVTTRLFKRGEFVVEYIGDLISVQEAYNRDTEYSANNNVGCYMYYFKHKEHSWW